MKSPVALLRAVAILASIALVATAPVARYHTPPTAAAQAIGPAGDLIELSIDNGEAKCASGPAEGQQVLYGWANKLTPPSYPVTLRSITIGFNRAGPLVEPDLLYRIVVYSDPEMDGPSASQAPDASFIGRLRGGETFMRYNLVTPLRITEGSIVVGAIDIQNVGGFPALFDSPGKSTPPGTESFITFNGGGSWVTMAETLPMPSPCMAGSFLIRATVETDPVDTFSVAASIKDPEAVEPYAVAVNGAGTEVLVTNYGSDNVTQVQMSDNSFAAVPVGDGPEGIIDGPTGVAIRADGTRAYVSLFGSETLPSGPQSIDFSALGPGRAAVLVKQEDGRFAQSVLINVGRGPLFPALSRDGARLYVPCSGDDRIDVINTATNEKVGEFAAGSNPTSCALSVDGAKLYVTNAGSGNVSVINALTGEKIKDVAIEAENAAPWKADVSEVNGHVYVATANAGIIVIDTCLDEVARAIIDEAVAISIPEAGGAAGLFGVAACRAGAEMIYTNSAAGVAGVIDTRIDQVVSAPPLAVCLNPRGVACGAAATGHRAYVACGQPDNSVTVLNVPELPENIADLPVIESVDFGNTLRLKGRGFRLVDRVEVVLPGSATCTSFRKKTKFKKEGRVIVQKGRLSDGRTLTEAVPVGSTVIIRVVDHNGSIRIIRFTRT